MPSLLQSFEDLETKLDEALAQDPAGLAGSVLAEALARQVRVRNKVAALDVRLAAAFDASKEWMVDGSRSAAAWMVTAGRERLGEARRRVRLGRELRAMPGVWAALAAGEINLDHVDFLAKARAGREAAFADGERRLVAAARRERFVAFDQVVRNWRDAVDPDGAEDRDAESMDSRRWHCSQSFESRWFVDGQLDPVGGSLYDRELQRLYDWLFEQDWTAAVARLGEVNVTAADLARTPAQRRADAQVLMAQRSASMTLGAGAAVRTVLNLVMDFPTFCAELARREGRTDVRFPEERTCRLDDGTVIAPSTALSSGLAGEIRRIVLDPDGVVLDLGQTRRGFTGDLRTAIRLTHEYCGHPAGCDVPSWRCQIDHLLPFTDGGPTAPENGDPKCGPHNRWKERLDAEIRRRRRWRRQHLDPRSDSGEKAVV